MKNNARQWVAFLLLFCLTASAYPDDLLHPITAQRVVDLTHTLHGDMPFWPGTAPLVIERLADYDKGYRMHRFSFWENIGTHVDAPAHFAEGKQSVNELGLNDLVVPIIVIKVQDKVARDDDYELSVDDVLLWEERNGRIPSHSLVVMNTGWYRKFHSPQDYINQDDSGVLHFPGFSVAATRLLVQRNVAGIGIDTLSLDPGNDLSFPVHHIMLAAGKYQVENMNNLDALPVKGAIAVIGVLPIKDASQAQARIFAFME